MSVNSKSNLRRVLLWSLLLSCLGVLLLLLIRQGVFMRVQFYDERPVKGKTRLLTYSLTVKNKSAEVVQDSKLRVFAPLKSTSFQRSKTIRASHAHKIISDSLGNQILEFSTTIPPYGTKIISVDAELEMSAEALPVQVGNSAIYLRAEKNIELEHPRIQSLAQELKGSSAIETARRAFNWIGANVQDQGYRQEDYGAAYAIENGKGDCTEFSYLFVALIRANGIPARVMGGFVVERDARLRGGEYHNWAEFYVNGAWELADPFKKVFGEQREKYVAFRVISEGEGSAMGASQRFVSFDHRLEVSLN